MSRKDLHLRIRRRLRHSITRARYRMGLDTLPTGAVSLADGFRHPISSDLKLDLVARYREMFPLAAEAELSEASRLLDHRFRLLGHDMAHPERISWARDPVSGSDWGDEFSPDIRYRGPDRLGDIKLPWELAKHQYFFTMGKARWLSDQPRFALEIRNQIADWIDTNPCHRGIHWISALESGTRVLSWILAYPFFGDSCDDAFRHRIAKSIAQHLLFIEQNISDGEFANTHLAGEAAVLVVGGLFINCSRSDHWVATGLKHLDAQISRQVHGDGVHAEQSIAYHRFFLDQYYLADAFLRANGRTLDVATLRRVEQMTIALMNLLFPDGSAPAFGDCDDARGLWCRRDCARDYASLLALGAARFGRGDLKYVAGEVCEEVLWLYGQAGLDAFGSLRATEPGHTSIGFPDSGYYVLRSGWRRTDSTLVFDCGPLGQGPAGHGHADALSLQLYLGGYNFLVDPGTYSYNLDYRWRSFFRSTQAHNTVTIDGLDQSEQRDRMSWATTASARCLRWTSTTEFDLVDGAHDGYLRLADPVSHRRVVVFLKPDTWFVWDLLDAGEEHECELNFHLRPDCIVGNGTATGPTELRSPGGHTLFLHGSVHGQPGAAQSWHSEEYGRRSTAQVTSYRRTFCQRTPLITVLSREAHHGFTALPGTDTLTISATPGSNRNATLFYRTSGTESFTTDQISFNGDLLFCNGEPSAAAVIHAEHFTVLAYGNDVDLRSEQPITLAELRGEKLIITTQQAHADQFELRVTSHIAVEFRTIPPSSSTASVGH